MACPYFYPVARLETNRWAVPPRLPLGDAYSGECRAEEASFQPDETMLQQCCNLGYGRGRCQHFPNCAEADAVRFHVAGETEAWIRIQYIVEKDCWPVLYGTTVFSIVTREFSAALPDEILRRQASAFIESYRRRCGK